METRHRSHEIGSSEPVSAPAPGRPPAAGPPFTFERAPVFRDGDRVSALRGIRRAGRRDRGRRARDRAEPSRHRLYAHVAWTTLHGLPLVPSDRAFLVEGHLIALCRRLDVEPIGVWTGRDRVHLVFRFKPNQSLASVVRRIKRGSSELLERAELPVRWRRGYALCTVAPDELRTLVRTLAERAEDG